MTKVLARHSSESGITGFTMTVLCAIAGVLYLFAFAICLIRVLDDPRPLLVIEPIAYGATCLVSSLLAFVAMRFWWRENFQWAFRLSAVLFMVSTIIVQAIQ